MTADHLGSGLQEVAADATRHRAARTAHARWMEASGAHLLVIDPRLDAAEEILGLRDALAGRGVHVNVVHTALDGLIVFGRTDPQAVMLSPVLPDLNACEVARKVGQYSDALIIAALDGTHSEAAAALMLAGASAAIARPYNAERVWEVMSRARHSLDDHARVTFGPIDLDARAYTVHIHGTRIADLPLKEFELLRTLMYRAPEVLTDNELREALWGDAENGPSDNTISVHAGRLRNRLQPVAAVRRIRGRGYSLNLC